MKEKNDVFYGVIDPKKVKVMDGFNQRIDFGDIDELAAQIKEQGLLQPISVVPYLDGGEERYLLVDGERRYRAIMKLIENGEDPGPIRAGFIQNDMDDDELFVQQYMRNEGKKFNDVELGKICRKLQEMGHNNSQIAKMLGKNPGVITYALQSLDFKEPIRDMIEKGEIGGSDVRRVYTAARKKYGEDWEEKANEEILAKKEQTATDTGKVSIKREKGIEKEDIYGDVKDTKSFVAGIKTLLQYASHFEKVAGAELDIDVFDIYIRLKNDKKLTLRDIFEQMVQDFRETA